MKKDFDFVVVGLGGIGSAAAYWLARSGAGSVLGLEQFEMGHHRGASQDHSRIIRHSYHSPEYVSLTSGAYEAWEELEQESGEHLVVVTGGLDLWPQGAAIRMEDYTDSLEACRVPFEILDAGEVMRRWPQWRLSDDVRGLYQQRGGIVAAARCNAAHQRMARAHGAVLEEGARVVGIRSRGDELEVVTEDVTYGCGALVLAADAWTNELLEHLDRSLPLTVTQEQVTYWAPRDAALFALDRFPIWIWMDEPSFYGFPAFGDGVKAAQDVGGREVTARTRTFDVDPEALARVERFMATHLPDALGSVVYTKTCLYTMPPDRDFVLDRVPGHDNVLVALGAAHGFKFASVFGRVLADLATTGVSPHDLSPFRLDRPALTVPNPAKAFSI
jgi:sarcosine oxidase